MWAGLDSVKDPAVLAQRLEELYFTGLPGILPLVHPMNLDLFSTDQDPYGATHGQVRSSQNMQAPFEMREFRVNINKMDSVPRVAFLPSTVKNTPLPELFDPTATTPLASQLRGMFAFDQVPLLGAERKIGCGLIWPNSLGQVHIDEHGTLSPALTEVLMPRRAEVLKTYLQACDQNAIRENLQPSFSGDDPK